LSDPGTNISAAVFREIAGWYPSYPFDWIWGRRIKVYCEEDQKNERGWTCSSKVPGQRGSLGAYVVNEEGKSKIVLCKPFFGIPTLGRVEKISKTTPPSKRI
jgi:hypothetical protein